MSASLVGSEMCIRDRERGAATRTCPPACGAWARAPSRARALANGGQPVSYTHLTLPTICSV
eukprot:1463484-Alexandrium_andersonii.AAC.1